MGCKSLLSNEKVVHFTSRIPKTQTKKGKKMNGIKRLGYSKKQAAEGTSSDP